jgi:putative transposase
MAVPIRGQRCWLWRALDNEGEVLDFVVQRNRDAKVAAKLIKKLLKRDERRPALIVPDKLRSYGCACRSLGLSGVHRQGFRANARPESLARCTWRGLGHFRAYVWSAVVAYNLALVTRLKPT